jgi:hypothetical protein
MNAWIYNDACLATDVGRQDVTGLVKEPVYWSAAPASVLTMWIAALLPFLDCLGRSERTTALSQCVLLLAAFSLICLLTPPAVVRSGIDDWMGFTSVDDVIVFAHATAIPPLSWVGSPVIQELPPSSSRRSISHPGKYRDAMHTSGCAIAT